MARASRRLWTNPQFWAVLFALTAFSAGIVVAVRFMRVPTPGARNGGKSHDWAPAGGDLGIEQAAEPPGNEEDGAGSGIEAELAAGARGPAAQDEGAGLPVIERSRIESDLQQERARGGPTDPIKHVARADAAEQPTASRPTIDRSPEEKQKRLTKFGGTQHTEGAVEAGLGWLAAHQSRDGSWERDGFLAQCPRDDVCGGKATNRVEYEINAGISGLSLLAFLGAGFTPDSGPYQETVKRGVEALLRRQQDHGGFSQTNNLAGYNDALATLALAECYAMTRDSRLERPLQQAVARIVRSQQDLGGWDYLPGSESGRNDTSITAWVVQALAASSAAGIVVPEKTLAGAAMHVARAAQPNGRVWYADSGEGFYLDSNQKPSYRFGPAMTACGLVCENLLGWRFDSALPRTQFALMLSDLPSSVLARGKDHTGLHSEYYWYYGTVAMFQGGGDHWDRWNSRLRDTILPLQNRDKWGDGRKKHAFGSWAPYGENWGKWGRMGGRVYTTAICVLTLEIYYRHTPAYLDEDVVLTPRGWRDLLQGVDPRTKLRAITVLRDSRYEIGEPVLIDLLHDADGSVAVRAAVALASIESPLGYALLDEVSDKLPPWERGPVERALARAAEVRGMPPVEGSVRLFDARSGLATLNLSRSYAGMQVSIRRDQREIARMEVIQRFTGKSIAIARAAERPESMPQEGDAAIGK